jgi:hexokinase
MTEPDAPAITEAMTAVDAARAAEEALRQAVHASWSGIGTAADVYTVVGAVGYSLELLPQLLDRLTRWLEAHHGALGVSEAGVSAANRVAEVRAEVAAALDALAAGRERLASAQAALAPLYGPLDPTARA